MKIYEKLMFSFNIFLLNEIKLNNIKIFIFNEEQDHQPN